jgi:hypothetical protein
MDPVVTVEADSVTVEPGGQASVTVRVRNLSSIVEGFRLDVLGEAAGWARVLPDRIEVLPQGEAMATVLFTPPSGVNTRAGQVPFGVRVVSQVDAGASAVAEGDLQVGDVSLSQVKITPATSKGRFSARHRVEFSNWGNTPVRLKLEASDPDEALAFLIAPELLDLPLGSSGAARIKVRARRPFMRGTPLRRQFRVTGRPLEPGRFDPTPGPAPQPYGHDPTVPAVDGAFEQRPIVGRGLLPLAVLAIAAAGVIGYLSSRPDKDPADETVGPPPPVAFAAEPISHDTARLHWDPGDRIDSYTVLTVDPATVNDPDPKVITTSPPIPGEQGQFDVPKLKAASQNCFQLVAVRGKAKSVPTKPQCITTAALKPPGAPPTPTDVAVKFADGMALITWQDASGGKADHIIRRGDTIVTTIDKPINEAKVDIVEGQLCYTVEASTGKAVSDPSPPVCLPDGTTSAGVGGAVGGGGGGGGSTPTNLKIVAVPNGNLIPTEDPLSLKNAQDRLAALKAMDIPTAGILLSTEYPDIEPALPKATYLVYIAGFDSEDKATAFCQGKGLVCHTFTPGPHQQVAAPAASGPPATTP